MPALVAMRMRVLSGVNVAASTYRSDPDVVFSLFT